MENEKIILIGIITGSILTFFLIIVIILFVVVYQRKIVDRENVYQLSLKKKGSAIATIYNKHAGIRTPKNCHEPPR